MCRSRMPNFTGCKQFFFYQTTVYFDFCWNKNTNVLSLSYPVGRKLLYTFSRADSCLNAGRHMNSVSANITQSRLSPYFFFLFSLSFSFIGHLISPYLLVFLSLLNLSVFAHLALFFLKALENSKEKFNSWHLFFFIYCSNCLKLPPFVHKKHHFTLCFQKETEDVSAF